MSDTEAARSVYRARRLGHRAGVFALLGLVVSLLAVGGPRLAHAQVPVVPASPEAAVVALQASSLRGVALPDGLRITYAIPVGPLFAAFTDILIIGLNGGDPPSFDDIVQRYAKHGVLAVLHENIEDDVSERGDLVAYALDSTAAARALVQAGAPLTDAATDYPTASPSAPAPALGDGGAVFAPGTEYSEGDSIEAIWSRGSIAFDLSLQILNGDVSDAHALALATQYDALIAALPPAAPPATPRFAPPTSLERAQAFDRASQLDGEAGTPANWPYLGHFPFDAVERIAAAPDQNAELHWLDDTARIVGGAETGTGGTVNPDHRSYNRELLYTADAASAVAALCTDPLLPEGWQPLQAPALGDAACAFQVVESSPVFDTQNLLTIEWTRGSVLLGVTLGDPAGMPSLDEVTRLAVAYDAGYRDALRTEAGEPR